MYSLKRERDVPGTLRDEEVERRYKGSLGGSSRRLRPGSGDELAGVVYGCRTDEVVRVPVTVDLTRREVPVAGGGRQDSPLQVSERRRGWREDGHT